MKNKSWSRTLDRYFIAFLRRVFRWSPAYKEARKRSLVKKVGSTEYHRCAQCNDVSKRNATQVDHIKEVVPLGMTLSQPFDWNWLRDQMCMENPENLQVLCKSPCHRDKTNHTNKLRKAVKK